MVVLGNKRLYPHFLVYGETKTSGKMVIFDQPNDLPGVVAQCFITLFGVFQRKEELQNHSFSNNLKSVLTYFALIMC